MHEELIREIHQLSDQLTEQNVYMGGKGFYQIVEEVPFPDNKNLFLAKSLKTEKTCLIEFASQSLDHIGIQKYLRRALFLTVLENGKGIISAQDFSINISRAFLVMDYVPGKDLKTILKYHTLTLKEALWILVDLTYALEHLSEFSFIHRNITPKNIILKKDEAKAYLGGVEHLTQSDFLQTRLEVNDSYASPELVRSLLFPNQSLFLTPLSDVYSLMSVFFHMITGEAPFPDRKDLERWSRKAGIPKIKRKMKRRDKKYCQYLIKKTMNRNVMKRWNVNKIRCYAMAYLETSDRQEDMYRWY